MTPTTRCAALLAAVALLALALPAWAAVAAALLVLGATLLDGLSVRRAPAIRREVGEVLSRGVSARLTVHASAEDARRVLLRQPATAELQVRTLAGARDLAGEIVPLRRGRHTLPGVASASMGPLGLARWHHLLTSPTQVLVYPDLLTARRLVLRLRQGRAAPDGRLRRGPLGLGTDFESIRDYSPDDDIRQVNWRATARLGRPMSNQYRVEQDRDVLCLLDTGRLMAAPVGHGTLLDAALDATAALALAADELGDRCGAIAFDASIRRALDPRRLGGRRVIDTLFDLQPRMQDSDFERAFLRVGNSRRGLVVIFSDLIDETAARSLVRATPMLARRHAVVVASVSDPDLEALAGAASAEGHFGRLSARSRHDDGAILGTRDAPDGSEMPDVYSEAAALSVLEARADAVTHIRRAGAETIQAPPRLLPERCVQAYLRAKARARL
jgi:uncharacterized protein (DUF58 family)